MELEEILDRLVIACTCGKEPFVISESWDSIISQLTAWKDSEVRKELERWRLKFDSVVRAHLWGDYRLSGTEVFQGCDKLLDELQAYIKELEKDHV